jgi:hypothetical protein
MATYWQLHGPILKWIFLVWFWCGVVDEVLLIRLRLLLNVRLVSFLWDNQSLK